MKKPACMVVHTVLRSVLVCLLLAPGGPAFAQGSNAQVSGLIVDSSGASVPGVKVTVLNTATNVAVDTETNTAGIYVVPQLIPGVYTVTVTASGFRRIEQTDVILRTGENVALNFTLELGTTQQEITVIAEAQLLSTSDARNANVIDNKLITQLPQLNRATLDYMSLNPSVQGHGPIQMGTSNSYMVGLQGSGYSLSGGQPNGTTVMVDGANMNEGDSNVLNRAIPSPDAIGELRVQTGVLTADAGRYSGGVVTASTLSGTNAFHGKLFEYFRNQLMNANSWYNNNHNISKDVRHQNNYGGAVGGPIRIPKLYDGRNRSFFFFAYEGQRFNTGSMSQSTVPTADERQGIFTNTIGHWDPVTGLPVQMNIFDPYGGYMDSNGSWVRPPFPNAVIPKQSWSKPGSALLNLYPLPNHDPLFNTSNQNNYWAPIQQTFPIDRLTVRVDENITAAHRLNVRVSRFMASDNSSAPFKDGQASTQTDLDWSGSMQYIWTPSATSIIEGRVGFSYSNLLIATGMAPDPNLDITKLGFDPLVFGTGNFTDPHIFPGGVFGNDGGYAHLGGYYPDRMPAQNYNATAAYTKILGRHTIKAGFEYYHTSMHEYGGDPSGADRLNASANATRQVWNKDNNTGYGGASLLVGAAGLYTWGLFNYSPLMRSFAGYVMDDWRVNTKLTVQMGLRIDHDGPKRMHYASTGVIWDLGAKNVLSPNANWNYNQVLAAVPGLANYPQPAWLTNGVNGRVGLLDSPEYPGDALTYTNAAVWQPRLGISWALDNKTVIHASGGIIYQGLYGLNMDAGGNIYYGKDIFNQTLTLDGMHYVSELGTDRGMGSFPLQPDGSHLGYVPAIKTNKDYWYQTYGQIPSPASGMAQLMDRHQNSPQEYDWGLSVQRQVGSSWTATAEYTGIRGIHMVQTALAYNFSNVSPQYYGLGSALYQAVPNPFYGQSATFSGEKTLPLWNLLSSMPQYSSAGLGVTTWGYMKAHYLNLQIQSRAYHGLSLLASYNIRKTLTTSYAKDWRNNGGACTNLQDPNSLDECYGVALYEIPQTLMFEYSYDLPVGRGRPFLGNPSSAAGKVLDFVIGGWGVAGITRYWPKGTPVNAPTVPNYNAAPNAVVRYSVNGPYKSAAFDPSCALLRDGKFVSGSPCRYFNPAAFVRTPDYSFGNLPIIYPDVRNPGGFSTDGTILKNFYFSEDHGRYFQIRAEAQDLFNHANYGSLNASPSSVGFGGLNGKSGNRIMQLGARIFF